MRLRLRLYGSSGYVRVCVKLLERLDDHLDLKMVFGFWLV